MFAKMFLALATGALLGSCQSPAIFGRNESPASFDPSSANHPATLSEACKGRDGWSDKAPPVRVFANTFMVGTCGITALLITTPKGHFLIDGATDEAAEGIAANIRALGFDPKDVRTLLITHEHLDHAGGIARLKAITGAKFAVRELARAAMETGQAQHDDPQHGLLPAFPSVKADQVITDGQVLRIGNQAITVMATPGHTPGGTSYTWKSCDGKLCRRCLSLHRPPSLRRHATQLYSPR
jgi:metallo-beta-lactamase class B